MVQFKQSIKRIPHESAQLPILSNNGIPEPIPLRDHVNYIMDLRLQLFCRTHQGEFPSTPLTVSLSSNVGRGTPLYVKEWQVVCMRPGADIYERELYSDAKTHGNRRAAFEREWVNTVHWEDVISLPPDTKHLTLSVEKRGAVELLFKMDDDDDGSAVQIRETFIQGLRYLMVKHRLLAYLFGCIVCYVVLSLMFLFTSVATFTFVSSRIVKMKTD